jgi:hypothetical protein
MLEDQSSRLFTTCIVMSFMLIAIRYVVSQTQYFLTLVRSELRKVTMLKKTVYKAKAAAKKAVKKARAAVARAKKVSKKYHAQK